ncbi:hypothetical protein HCZ87_08075 [Phaeobacter sp. HF9A]|nr:hypothetical protein [Phaeobacter sp. HF9A]
MRSDGLIVVEPRRVVRSRISGRSLILFVCVILAFKGFLMATLGPANYDYRVEKLRDGSLVEQGGAWIMQADPASAMIAERLAPLLR